MRTAILMVPLLATILTGAAAMTPATADDKKEPPVDPKFPEKVTYRKWDDHGKKFLPASNDCPAKFIDAKGRQAWKVKGIVVGGDPTPGSEIISTDKDGNKTVWIVEKIEGGGEFHVFECKKKDPPKKD